MDTNRASEANVNKQISSIILFLTSSTDLFLSRVSLPNFDVNTVVMSFPLDEVIQNKDATGRIAKWVLELMGQGIAYVPRTTVQS